MAMMKARGKRIVFLDKLDEFEVGEAAATGGLASGSGAGGSSLAALLFAMVD